MALGVVVVSVLYVAWHLARGWVPWDEGALGHAAERVLHGELPHRDFDDIYTGGLAFLDAAAFRMFGVNLWSLRLPLLASFAAWVPVVHYLATRVARPVPAGAITLLAVAWSLPNYNAAMPSWYNLFLATFGIAAVYRHCETRRARWLFAAGIAAALSIIVKVVGLYFVAGVLLYFVFDEQLTDHLTDQRGTVTPDRRVRSFSLFVTASLILFATMLARLVLRRPFAPEVVQFALPGIVLAAFLIRQEWSAPAGPASLRFTHLLRLALPFLAGVVVPIAIFLLPYLRSQSTDAMVNGVFVLPMRRFGVATMLVPPIETMLLVVPPLALLWVAPRMTKPPTVSLVALTALLIAAVVYVSGSQPLLYRFVWYSVRWLFPVLAVIGVLVLSRPRAPDDELPGLRRLTFLLLAATSMCSLVQFPYAAPNYFFYIAPLVALSALALYRYRAATRPLIPASIVGFYMLFAVVRLNPAILPTMGLKFLPFWPMAELKLDRGGIDVPRNGMLIYTDLVTQLRARARGGYTWASPDCPEIYFLSGLRNPTRSMFDFFDEPAGRTEKLLRQFDEHGVTAIVLNAGHTFSLPPSEQLVTALEQRFPFARNIGPFQLRWRS